jgi:hypothetical protein
MTVDSLFLSLSATPFWLLEPEHQSRGVGGIATFNCLAKAVPEPQYFWYVNGVPLNRKSLFYLICLVICFCIQ